MRKVFILIFISILLLVCSYYMIYQQIFKPGKPIWLSLEENNQIKNQQIVILEIQLNQSTISHGEQLKFNVIVTNRSKDNLYLSKSWLDSKSIVNNMYDTNKHKFICDYPTSCRPIIGPFKMESFVAIKPNEKKAFHKTFFLQRGILWLGGFFPYLGSYLYDGINTYVLLNDKETVFLRVLYFVIGEERISGERYRLNIFKDYILSNEAKFSIRR